MERFKRIGSGGMAMKPFTYEDIVELLSKLADWTPEYPVHLMCEQRVVFQEGITLPSTTSDSTNFGTKIFV